MNTPGGGEDSARFDPIASWPSNALRGDVWFDFYQVAQSPQVVFTD